MRFQEFQILTFSGDGPRFSGVEGGCYSILYRPLGSSFSSLFASSSLEPNPSYAIGLANLTYDQDPILFWPAFSQTLPLTLTGEDAVRITRADSRLYFHRAPHRLKVRQMSSRQLTHDRQSSYSVCCGLLG